MTGGQLSRFFQPGVNEAGSAEDRCGASTPVALCDQTLSETGVVSHCRLPLGVLLCSGVERAVSFKALFLLLLDGCDLTCHDVCVTGE